MATDGRLPSSLSTVGVVEFATVVEVAATRRALCELAVDLERYQHVEPRLKRARWLDVHPPRAGSRADIEGDIPFSVPSVQALIGPPRGIATLEEFEPPQRFTYGLQTHRAKGRLRAELFDTAGGGCVVDVHGWIVPHSALGRLALVPLAPLLRQLASQAVRRGVLRAAAAAHEG